MTVTDVITIIRKIVDIALVWMMFYFILKNIRSNVKLSLIFKGVAFVILLRLVSDWFGFTIIQIIIDYIIQW